MGSLKGKTQYLFIHPFLDYKCKHLLSALDGPRHCAQCLTMLSLLILTTTSKQVHFNLHVAGEETEPLEKVRNSPKVNSIKRQSQDSTLMGCQGCVLNHCAILPPCVRTSLIFYPL